MKRFLVIGGCGFLGRHIAEKLIERGHDVHVFDIRQTFDNDRIKFFVGDLCNIQDLCKALKGVDVVIHCATPSPLSNNKELFMKVNFEGTKTIIQACKDMSVQKLVLTSSASVLYDGNDIMNADEDMPYASNPMDFYVTTKILQEKLVLEANCKSLRTVAIRPHGIFGPRDPHLLPSVAKTAKAGKSKFIIGDGKNIVDFTYVDNVVHGHILAAEQLDNPNVSGKAYHITNDEPLEFWGFLSMLVKGLNYRSAVPSIRLPFTLIYAFSVILSFISMILRPIKDIRPTFTPSVVRLAGTHHYYSCARAKRDLGYKPLVSVGEGIERTLEYFDDLKAK